MTMTESGNLCVSTGQGADVVQSKCNPGSGSSRREAWKTRVLHQAPW